MLEKQFKPDLLYNQIVHFYIDKKGEAINSKRYGHAGDFSPQGTAVVNRRIHIDASGQPIHNKKFRRAWNFNEDGLALVHVTEGYPVQTRGYYRNGCRQEGKTIFPNQTYCFINKDGECIPEKTYEGVSKMFEGDNGSVFLEIGRGTWIDVMQDDRKVSWDEVANSLNLRLDEYWESKHRYQ